MEALMFDYQVVFYVVSGHHLEYYDSITKRCKNFSEAREFAENRTLELYKGKAAQALYMQFVYSIGTMY